MDSRRMGRGRGTKRSAKRSAKPAVKPRRVAATRRRTAAPRLNAELRAQTARLEALNHELEAFNYSVSHDLRAPLRAISGFSQALREDYGDRLDVGGHELLDRVLAAAQRMSHLIDALLELSRLTRRDITTETVDITALAHAVITDLRAHQPDRQVTFTVDPGLSARADPRLLRLALENLLGNAWKFTSKRESADIELRQQQTPHGTAYCVRDNGAGFNPNITDKLFGAFQRLHAADEFDGTGIGLATVQRIIHRHGGRVWAEGEPDRGAAFYFTLP